LVITGALNIAFGLIVAFAFAYLVARGTPLRWEFIVLPAALIAMSALAIVGGFAASRRRRKAT
jgi:hypothetical protein